MADRTSQGDEAPPAPPRPVKLTVEIDPDLHKRLRVLVAVEGTTVAAVVRDLLQERLRDW